MSPKLFVRSLALFIAAVSFSAIHLAAQDAPSVAEAARRTREQKQASAKPAKVLDNDSLPHSSTPSQPDSSAPATPSASDATPKDENAAASQAPKQPTADSSDDEKKKAEVEALKQQIADKKHSIDLLQREISLAQDTFYSNPDHVHDTAGKDKLDSMRADLQQQQADLADLQAKLAELGGSEDSKPAPAQPPQPSSM
jgi:uncharacterized protein YhaN